MMRTIAAAALFCMVFSAPPAQARIRTLPFPELVRTAQVIVIARVIEKVGVPRTKSGPPRIRNILMPERILKGDLATGETFEILTPDTGGRWVEDVVVFPGKGQRVVLFLRKGPPETSFRLVNGIQGLWPMEDGSDKTLGMGFRYSVSDIERELEERGSKPHQRRSK